MRFVADEIGHETLGYGTFSGMSSNSHCRVRLGNCDGTFSEELIVPVADEELEFVGALPPGAWVCVHFWDGKPVRIRPDRNVK
jgi:hypothetical protein